MKIVLISCGSQKRKSKSKAKDLYTSTIFRRSLLYANAFNPGKIYILSAKHHLLDLEKRIEPYNVTLSIVPLKKRKPNVKYLTKEEKEIWGRKVIRQISSKHSLQKDKFIIMASKEYLKPIISYLKFYKDILKGLNLFERQTFLKKVTS